MSNKIDDAVRKSKNNIDKIGDEIVGSKYIRFILGILITSVASAFIGFFVSFYMFFKMDLDGDLATFVGWFLGLSLGVFGIIFMKRKVFD